MDRRPCASHHQRGIGAWRCRHRRSERDGAARPRLHRLVSDTMGEQDRLAMWGSLALSPYWRCWLVDARHYQIASLAALLTLNLTWLDFGADPRACAVLIATCCLAQIVA